MLQKRAEVTVRLVKTKIP